MDKSDILRAWYDEVWIEGKLDAIDTFFRPDTQAAGVVQGMELGADDFRDLVTAMRHRVEDLEVDIPKTIEQDDWLAALLSVRATDRASGAPIKVFGQVFAKFQDGKMIETYNQFDYVALFEQLGQFPANTVPACMTGQTVDFS